MGEERSVGGKGIWRTMERKGQRVWLLPTSLASPGVCLVNFIEKEVTV